MNTLHGELYLDSRGKPHFICHTPADMTFEEAKTGLLRFIALLQNKVDEQKECPYYNPEGKTPRERNYG